MSNDISGIYGSLISSGLLNNSTTNSSTANNSNSSAADMLAGALSGSGSSNGASSELVLGMMMGMMGAQSSSDSDSSSSYSSGFNVMLSSLLNAMNEKNKQVSQGLASNASSSNTAANGAGSLEELNQLVLRTLTGYSTEKTDLSTVSNSERIQSAVSAASKKYGVSEDLIKAIIQTESNFNVNAKSGAGAMGLMQLMPATAAAYGAADPYNIEQNVDAGTHLISKLLNQFDNNLGMALAGYNYGTGNMASRGIASTSDFYKLPDETKNYITKITSILNA